MRKFKSRLEKKSYRQSETTQKKKRLMAQAKAWAKTDWGQRAEHYA